MKVTGSILQNFRWLTTYINLTAEADLPRILIFFANINYLVDAYQYVTLNTRQLVGSETPKIVMYHLITDSAIKSRILSDLGNPNGFVRVSLCSSSLSMGINLVNIQYVVHYGVPTTADCFLQETGRASREASVHAHSILLKFPKMKAGRKVDETMKDYAKGETCLRGLLLRNFGCSKPAGQQACCDVCDPHLSCHVKSYIVQSYESSLTESFSDSLSIASVGDVDDVPDL